jgi:antitoxin HicB
MSESPTRGYAIQLQEEDDDTWTALVPDLPGAVAAGADPVEAIGSVGDAIDAWIASARADGQPVPAPSRTEDEYSGRFVVRVPRSLHRALVLGANREGVSLNTYCITALTQCVTAGLVQAQSVRTATDLLLRTRVLGVGASGATVLIGTAGGDRIVESPGYSIVAPYRVQLGLGADQPWPGSIGTMGVKQ